MSFVARVALRWSDMDALGHINNSEYLRYLEQARIEFLSEAAAAGVPREAGLLVARHEVDYRKPMPYQREPVEVPTWIDRIGTTSFTFGHEVIGGEVVYARARTVIVCIDDAGRPTPVPTTMRKYLEQFAR
ncbi:MAG: acyl-CoA thioesterase [Candidatus Nanopelagicales bacterium]|jgi:acyl-CoA thioester hydrolase|nr:acyl-CoA thioesterase [Candidatus Nanopelagicales bacterium]